MCPPMYTHWRHLANMIELCFLRPTWVHNPNSKSIGSAISAQLTTESPYTLPWASLSPTIAPYHGGSGHRLTHDSLGHSEPTIQKASQTVQPFSHRWLQSVPILYNGPPISPKLPLPMGDLDPHLIHASLGSPKSSTQIVTGMVQPFLQGSLVWQTDRRTDRPHYSVGNNRPHLNSTHVVQAMQSNNNNNNNKILLVRQ